ncbi:enoyl-CoA hydratase/isomerase family protein [Gymnodinialimonas ceratoperidinii]|uniref:Enoyl-CoA hydratase/isomerase family protein n=1 Tax=Gymnodinialimonas ceratoperidinii TaxID=2856823 RepID=A0A8F6YA70_9RHOB|nr:enoyl-CoA hydratase/isomerase family protein [Gymnodinialimonas ceratoperidinii]QXT38676.1 enoyl-CoA hydratase/isomerase family protein [Gymnodinialimonas ceratoperidinii]
MSKDIDIRIEGRAGRITLTRPKALNALSYDMCLAIEVALDAWAEDDAVALVMIDAEGERAFCAGGDIQEMYETGTAGNFEYGRRFWADEYRMNAKMFRFPKPVVAFMQGFTMGGGVGIGCHGSHRIVCESSQMAMPECGIGLVPDVGGTLLLARAPGRLGEYLGVTATRMGPGDAIHAEFADYYVPEAEWPALKAELLSGDHEAVDRAAATPPESTLKEAQAGIDHLFGGETLRDVLIDIAHAPSEIGEAALKKMQRNSPLAMACTIELVHRARMRDDIEHALRNEYRFTARSMERGDFLEGIRAAIIDKDRSPKWKHAAPADVTLMEVAQMLQPLGADEWSMD